LGALEVKIFIIHGWAYNLDKWTKLCELLKTSGIEPILLRVPGLTAPSDKVWTISGYEEWLAEQLQGHKSPVVVGHSNGGRIALAYAQNHPGHLRHLILIDSAGVPRDRYLLAKIKLKVLKILAKLGRVFGRIGFVKKVFYKIIGAQDYLQAPPNMKKTMQNMLDADKTIDLSKIDVPVTLIWGEDDTMTPLRDGRVMQQGIKNANLHVVHGARHAPMASHPNQIAQIITDTLKALS